MIIMLSPPILAQKGGVSKWSLLLLLVSLLWVV